MCWTHAKSPTNDMPSIWAEDCLKSFFDIFFSFSWLYFSQNIKKLCTFFLQRFFNATISFQKSLIPPLSPELAVSFYLQNGKLMFAVYHVVPETKTGGSKFNRYQADCIIPWVNDVIFLLSVALQKSQELVDKVNTVWKDSSINNDSQVLLQNSFFGCSKEFILMFS